MKKRELELLAPAANSEIAIQAILHGADAVYIGARSHGARKSACNSVEDIKRVVDFAHRYRSRVYVTVNTIVYEHELGEVERLCRDLYRIGVDALIVQDMGLLRLDLPPIALHASTQCDIRTPEKAIFLQEAGFSQLVLARELTLGEIRRITDSVSIPVECFVHGALCVCYSGRCHASYAETGRSANRGECSQLCRLAYDLIDGNGKEISRNKHLLSLKDFNVSPHLGELIEAGVSSFKIEGRLKEMDYVKNNTAFYNNFLNDFISERREQFRRVSYGEVIPSFEPSPDKSFNRGFTDYFLNSRRAIGISSPLTPKSMGEIIHDVRLLHNGDGISFFDKKGQYQGVNVNKIVDGKIIPAKKINIPSDAVIHRTNDLYWKKQMEKNTADRRIGINVILDKKGVTAVDERGLKVRLPLDVPFEMANDKMKYEDIFRKLGSTIYKLRSYESRLDPYTFIPRSALTEVRRRLVELLDVANTIDYRYEYRRKENPEAIYPIATLDFRENVSNSLSKAFYEDHGVVSIKPALEAAGHPIQKGTILMTTRHCILRELGLCKKEGHRLQEPLRLVNVNHSFILRFDCNNCEMVVTKG